MKKIIRIASVIALASASLLYVGCTKDFSADIAKTNQDVAALNQKIETLNSTVQTINGTVENLKTTKADLSAVNALGDKVTTAEGKITTLGGKIDDLDGKLTSTKNDLTAAIATAKQEAIDAASADAATKLAAAKTELEGVINGVKVKVDSLEAFTVAQTDSLRKDVDSLYANCEALEARIAALEGKVIDLAARVSSIVAVPSMNAEFRHFALSGKDTTFFAATFAVTPKAAVENIKAENLTVNFKQGLTRAAGLDTTFKASKVIVDKENGEITVFVGFKKPNLPSDEVKIGGYAPVESFFYYNYISGENLTGTLPESTVYYSLAFAGEDKAGKYEENSEYVKAHNKLDEISIENAVIVKDGAELAAEDKDLKDTLAFDGSEGTKFASLFGDLDVAFKFNDELISKEDIAELLDTTFKVVPDTAEIQARINGAWRRHYPVNDSTAGIVVTSDKGTNLCAESGKAVGNFVYIGIRRVKINDEFVNFGDAITERHYVGAKTVEYTLPSVTEDWTYMTAEVVSRTVSITNGETAEAIHNLIVKNGVPTSADNRFAIAADAGKGVDVKVENAPRNAEAKDTVYNVVFTKAANIESGDSVKFAINWKYTLAARPADETIALANVDTLANDYTQGIDVAIDSNIVDETFAAFDAAYDKAIDTTVVNEAIEAAVAAINTANVYFEGDTLDPWTVSNGKVVVPALTKAGAYEVELEAKVFGIKYTYTYTINLAWKEALKLHPTPYVSAGVAVVDADTTGIVYRLGTMDIAKYLQVFNADTLAKGFEGYRVDVKVALEDSAKFANEFKDTTVGEFGYFDEAVPVVDGLLRNGYYMNWWTYEGREVEITAFLATGNDTVDTYTFKLKYNKPITSFVAGTQEVKRVAGENAEAVLTKSFDVKGLYHGDKNIVVDTTGAWIDGRNYYNCEIWLDLENAVFKVDGTETIFTSRDYQLSGGNWKDETTGLYCINPGETKIVFLGDNNNKPIEASIPVVLTYNYDYNHVEAYKDNVVIKVVNE